MLTQEQKQEIVSGLATLYVGHLQARVFRMTSEDPYLLAIDDAARSSKVATEFIEQLKKKIIKLG